MGAMVQLWDIALAEAIKAKGNVVQWWSGENEANAGFTANGATLGLCWDSTGYNLRKDGYKYIAPVEGAFAWHQGFVLMKNAKNIDQAHEFIKFVSTPEGAAGWATAFSSNPVGKGAADLMDPEVKAYYNGTFNDEALSEAVVVAGADGRVHLQARRVRRQVQGGLIDTNQETAGFRTESGGFLLRCKKCRA